MNPRPFDFLVVDRFLRTLPGARALQSALELGVIDELIPVSSCPLAQVAQRVGGDPRATQLLLDLLAANGVIHQMEEQVQLTDSFRGALPYRDLLEAKLDFANVIAPDFVDRFSLLLTDSKRFMAESRLFDLFDYRHCLNPTLENVERVRKWMRFTTLFTRYEAQACLHHCDFGPHRRMLDIGGNSGEFVLQICKAHPTLAAEVFDLPVVCEIGRQHIAREAEANRIRFHSGDALRDPLPAGCDLISFKSMLHDWPQREAKQLLTRASQALAPGGTLLIFERGPIEPATTEITYAMLPMLLFFRSFRSPKFYCDHLEAIGLTDVRVQWITLEMPFFLVTARLGEESTCAKTATVS